MSIGAGLMILTAAYTGLRWGELAGLQWTRTHLDDACPRIDVDATDGALHELGGRLELGPPKSTAGARTVHLPPFLADLLTVHRDHHPDTPFVFTGANGGLHRRPEDIDDLYTHVTPAMREKMLTALQQRWLHSGGRGMAQLLEPGPDAA
ncbi:hypothetical protein [Pseudonocardia cypriaca]|uniref:hypothetical protein n=1 Tax=Pseudonocardia cypriaca TaxID=882449 RepID=UPI001154B48C|nr:hypothetical protein [Pseudonocardia cypriaca]